MVVCAGVWLEMTPFVDDPDFTLHVGDALETLRLLPDGSVDCVATSPPFYALRDYGTGAWEGGDPECEHKMRDTPSAESSTLGGSKATVGHQRNGFKGECPRCGAVRVDSQIGLEETPELWAASLVAVFAECRRVLTSTGTLWVECGDSYVSGQGGRQSAVGELPPSTRFDRKEAGEKRPDLPSSFGERDVGPRFYPGRDTGLKPKDLLGSPWLLAFALRADGWWLRQAIVWHKPNAMPESATDRCTTAHSYVFLLSKSARYHFDGDAIGEEFSLNTHSRGHGIGTKQAAELNGGTAHAGRNNASFGNATKGDLAPHLIRVPQAETLDGSDGESPRGPDGRRATRIAATGPGGHTNHANRAGADRWPSEQKHPRSVWTIPTQGYPEAHFATWPEKLVERIILAGCPEGGTVLDPFMGSGTTALVARKHGRKSVGIELNESYAALAAKRLGQQSLLAEGAV